MAKAEASVEELVGMIERGELRLPEMQRQLRLALDAGARPAGFAVSRLSLGRDPAVGDRRGGAAAGVRCLAAAQPLPEHAAAARWPATADVAVGRDPRRAGEGARAQRPIELLFNLEHPDELAVVTEVNEEGDDDEDDLIEDEADSRRTSCSAASTR